MKTFEYLTLTMHDGEEPYLNSLAKDGWRVIYTLLQPNLGRQEGERFLRTWTFLLERQIGGAQP